MQASSSPETSVHIYKTKIRISQFTPIISLNTINWFVFVRKIQYVFCEVWAFDRPTSFMLVLVFTGITNHRYHKSRYVTTIQEYH